MSWGGEPGRHVANMAFRLVLETIETAHGRVGVAAALERAREHRPLEELTDDTCWSSYDQFRSFLESAAETLGGVEGLHAIGDAPITAGSRPSTLELVEALGSPHALFAGTASSGSNGVTTFMVSRGQQTGPDEWLIENRAKDGFEPFAANCAFNRGLLTIGPRLFGYDDCTVVEETCQLRGADACQFRVRWAQVDEMTRRCAKLELSNTALRGRLESFQTIVSELVQADDLDAALDHVVDAAAHAVGAPGFLLAVEPMPGVTREVYSQGLPVAEAERIAATLLAGGTCPEVGDMVVDVASHRQRYGLLAAYNPDGLLFAEGPLLEAYARLAATALDSATALETARREADRAQALLALARSLAEATTLEDVARCLVEATAVVIGSDRALFAIADHPSDVCRAIACHGFDPETEQAVLGKEFPLHGQDHARFVYLDPRTTIPNSLAVAMVVVPIVVDGIAEAWLTAEVVEHPERLTPNDELEARLRGLAAQAATAMRNARLIENIRHMALHDTLTSLPNRALVLDRAEHLLAGRRGSVSALFLDLDGFKELNDTLGHAAGDHLLRVVAGRLSDAIRDDDTLARMGGDEFVLLVNGSDPELLAERLLAILREPIELDGSAFTVTASIGVARATGEVTADQLVREADVAMYQAKSAGKNRYITFVPEMHQALRKRIELEIEAREAVDRGQLHLVYQPVIDLATGRVTGAEALLRWRHPTRGLVGPCDLIPVLEETGLIAVAGRWVLEQACRQAAAWRGLGRDIDIAVNISPRQLEGEGVLDDVRSVLAITGLDPSALIIEITESTLLHDMATVTACVAGLKELGVRLALDDFGTGCSSIACLRQLPVDILKIDRSFVSASTTSEEAGALLRMLVQLGRSLELTVVAEGVEHPEQLAQLAHEGCHEAQGFLFARPLEARDLFAFLDRAPVTRV